MTSLQTLNFKNITKPTWIHLQSFWHIYFTPVCPVLYLRHSLCYKNYCITNISSGQKCFKTLYLAFITQWFTGKSRDLYLNIFVYRSQNIMQMSSCKGFLQGSCHVLITVFSVQKVSSDGSHVEGLYLSSALRLSSQIALANRETSVSLCVTLETRASK